MAAPINDLLKSPEQVLAAARYQACFKLQPYMSCAIHNMITVWTPGLGTIGITEHMHLLIDPDKFMEWYQTEGIDVCGWILIHEVNHLLRDHTARARRMGVTAEIAGTVNACQDAEINDDIPDAKNNLPKGYCWLPEDLNKQEPGKMWEEYYAGLPLDKNGNKSCKKKGGKGTGQGQGQGGQGGAQPSPEDGGQCGSGATGVPLPQEDGLKGSQDTDAPGKSGQPGQPGQDPDQTDVGAGRSQAEIERIKNQVAADIQGAMKGGGRGSVPAGYQRWANEQLRPPTIPWRQMLAKVTRGAVGMAAGQKDYTFRMPSRRQAGVGYGLGMPVLPRMFSPTPRILIAVDTSGSMSEEALTACLAEVGGILKSSNTDVTICSCDSEVHAAKRVRKIHDAASQLKGGGGTDFRPVFEYVENEMRLKPNVIFFFTDGDGPAPERAPKGIDVVWILVDGYGRAVVPTCGRGKKVTYGKVVRVPPITNGIETPHDPDDYDDD